MTEAKLFERGLSAEFLAWLSKGAGKSFLDTLLECGVDIRIRDDYFNAYEAGSSVAKVSWRARQQKPRIEVSAAYVVGTPFASAVEDEERPTGYVGFLASTDRLKEYQRILPEICERVRDKLQTPEGKWEADVVRTNQLTTPFAVFDRQVPCSGQRKRLDVLAVSRDNERPYLVALEIRRELDNRIESVPLQVEKYLEIFDPEGNGLREDIAGSYANICRQLSILGIPGPPASLIQPGMAVEGLIALARYNTSSAWLGRARQIAAKLKRTIWFCTIEDANPRIPPIVDWYR